ncbi:hypothetical protein BU15DRAFT_44647 [Melanogaster broomeanus]|nr:hypothetical protein BU15DRAFT_44647 [Melanogaster broomeanus]
MDRVIRDGATNALIELDEPWPGIQRLPDWTQDIDPDAEINDYGLHDTEEANHIQATAPYTSASVPASKLPVPARPLIWAQSRQEVCESFEYFRSYHGGVYSNKGIVKGYLLGAYAASRDLFHHEGKLIISHGGGKSESTLDSGRRQAAQDQEASDKSVGALLKTYKEGRPLVLLVDDQYALFPYDLAASKYTYVVLGMYSISHAWAECQPTPDGLRRIVRWKFAFQWCEGQGNPWWMTQQGTNNSSLGLQSCKSSEPPSTARFPPDLSVQCEACLDKSPTVYKQGWTCLNPRCSVFWSINGEEPHHLEYCEEFLKPVPQQTRNLPNIMPDMAVLQTPDPITTTYSFSKGWHCKACGRLSCRFKWEHWECSNCQVSGRVRLAKEFWHQRPAGGILHAKLGEDSGILSCRAEPIDLGTPKGFTNRLTFILPNGRGKIHLILGTPLSNVDADVIFQKYQQQASTSELKLRRYPLRNHKVRGQLLTNYFSQNSNLISFPDPGSSVSWRGISGISSFYVGGTGNTIPFHEAPDCVKRALALIMERSKKALRIDIPFNEILTAAYMERQKMSGDVLVMEGDGVQKYYEHTVIPMNFRIAATARCIGLIQTQ